MRGEQFADYNRKIILCSPRKEWCTLSYSDQVNTLRRKIYINVYNIRTHVLPSTVSMIIQKSIPVCIFL